MVADPHQLNWKNFFSRTIKNPLNAPYHNLVWQAGINRHLPTGENLNWNLIVSYLDHCRELFSRNSFISHAVKRTLASPLYLTGLWQKDSVAQKTSKQLKTAMEDLFRDMNTRSQHFVMEAIKCYQTHLNATILLCLGSSITGLLLAATAPSTLSFLFSSTVSAYYGTLASESMLAKLLSTNELVDNVLQLMNNVIELLRPARLHGHGA